MSGSGAVYQPTTVTYENDRVGGPDSGRWSDRPISYLASSVTQAARTPCGISCIPSRSVLPIIYLTSSIACFAIGLTMVINGALGYAEPQPNEDGFYLSITIIGTILFVVACLLVALYLRATRRLCFRSRKEQLGGGGSSNGCGNMSTQAVNPSTDLLVTAQYAPVSEVAYQPPLEDSEQTKLMSSPPQDTKDNSNEDNDRMVESDPRIVLRPLNTATFEET